MNKAIPVLSGLLGATVGFVAGMFVAKRIIQKQADETIELMRGMFERKLADKEAEQVTIQDKKTNNTITSEYRGNTCDDIADMLDDVEEEEYDESEEDEDPVYAWGYDENNQPYGPPNKDKDPYLIPVAQAGERPYFDTDEYTYFEPDDVIADDYGALIERNEWEMYFGSAENVHAFGYDPTQPDIVVIRNERYQLDYVISRSGMSWADYTAGGAHE